MESEEDMNRKSTKQRREAEVSILIIIIIATAVSQRVTMIEGPPTSLRLQYTALSIRPLWHFGPPEVYSVHRPTLLEALLRTPFSAQEGGAVLCEHPHSEWEAWWK